MATHDTILAGDATTNTVLERRLAHRWSQADLARRVGVSRASISAMEGKHLTPSVTTALALAAVFKCSVEELFGPAIQPASSDPAWAWSPRGDTCRYWDAVVGAQHWLYPVELTVPNPIPHDGICLKGSICKSRSRLAETTLVMACCDPVAGMLAAEYAREYGFRLLVFSRGGGTALNLLRNNLVHVAGIHRSTTEKPELNEETVRVTLGHNYCLLCAAEWEEGIALPSMDKTNYPEALMHRSLRWAAREEGSVARECLNELAGGRQISGCQVTGHSAVAEAVRSGWADAGICVRYCAEEAGLKFLPLRRERLDLCFSAAIQNEPRIQALVHLLRSWSHRQLIGELPGYNSQHTGEIVPV